MQKKQVFNPYLPLNTYIPDGEPHVFGDRLYVYGSHDAEGGTAFCVLDYEVWSAPLTDLTDWSCPGVAYRASQDPDYADGYTAMYAPDCVQGRDGRYYLYYAMAGKTFTGPIHVAVSDRPDGPFQYHGCVHHADGRPLTEGITFDPAVMMDDGVVRLYYGWSLDLPAERAAGVTREALIPVEMQLFSKTEEELRAQPEGIHWGLTVTLADDMLTVTGTPKRILPGCFDAAGTSFAEHPFFEGSSIRKIGGRYCLVYSSIRQHELCYAWSDQPDGGFTFGGVIISNGDIGYRGRTPENRLAMTGNNHGGLVNVNRRWYIFYHRHTHKTCYSRQGCAEKVTILPDGTIPQVEMTSCGLNDGPLLAQGDIPAAACCNLYLGTMPHANNESPEGIPYITHEGDDRLIADITEGTVICWKYLRFAGDTMLTLTHRGGAGTFEVYADDAKCGEVPLAPSESWTASSVPLQINGDHALRLVFHGKVSVSLKTLSFARDNA